MNGSYSHEGRVLQRRYSTHGIGCVAVDYTPVLSIRMYVCISIDRIRLLKSHAREAQYDEYTSESDAKKKNIYIRMLFE